MHAVILAGGKGVRLRPASRTVRVDFGVLETTAGRIVGFTESFGFDELIRDVLRDDRKPASYDFGGYWLDVGRPDDHDEANRKVDELLPLLFQQRTKERV